MDAWSEEEIVLLREKYNESYEELMRLFPGRSLRSLKHKITDSVDDHGLGLKRSERKRWSEEEIKFLNDNPSKTASELAVVLGRSAFQVANKLRLVGNRGTAKKVFLSGWDRPSRELAYVLGAWCSDGTVSDYVLAFSQHEKNIEFLNRVNECVEKVFGLSGSIDGDSTYKRLNVCSRLFKDVFSLNGAVAKPEWIKLLDEQFLWVWDDAYFWSFIGGLYDGDGSLAVGWRVSTEDGVWRTASFGIKPVNSRSRIQEEFRKRDMEFVINSKDENGVAEFIALKGGKNKLDEFLSKVDSVLAYKKGVLDSGFRRISREEANDFLKGVHYLKDTLRPGVICYGGFKNSVLIGVACYGSPISYIEQCRILGEENKEHVWELVRFASCDDVGKNFGSAMLAKTGKMLADEKDVWLVITYADSGVGHTGGLYRAAGYYYLGFKKGKHRYAGIVARERKDEVRGLFLLKNRERLEDRP